MSASRTKKSGFTLVEILIVVIILGILAAIVIPQFTDASEGAKKNSLISQVQTIRSQIELYKSSHSSTAAGAIFSGTGDAQWTMFTKHTNYEGGAWTTGDKYGPYLQSKPVNGLNGKSGVLVSETAIDELTYNTAAGDNGFIYDKATGKFWAFAKTAAGDGTTLLK